MGLSFQLGKPRILIAPACFKGSLSAAEVAEVLAAGLRAEFGNEVMLDCCPIADGGDDTLAVLAASDTAFQMRVATVTGPLPSQRVQAQYLMHPAQRLLVIEAAQAHGLKLLPSGVLAPLLATSYGVGQLIQQACQQENPSQVVVSLGGSASTDGGAGALQALGVQWRNHAGDWPSVPISGQDLSSLVGLEAPMDWKIPDRVMIATDVTNPLLGKEGAAAVFAPQKGATPPECRQLEQGLETLRDCLVRWGQVDYSTLPGVGAAGGLAYGLKHLPGAEIISGWQWIAAQLKIPERLAQADIILTGEGRFDRTSLVGKGVGQLLSQAANKPVFLLCGQVTWTPNLPPEQVYSLVDEGYPLTSAMANPRQALETRMAAMLPAIHRQLNHLCQIQ